MAMGGSWTLTDRVIARLAAQIPPNEMETVAEGYLGLDHVMVQDLRQTQGSNAYGFKVEVLHKWAKMNPGDNQAKVSAQHAACTSGLVELKNACSWSRKGSPLQKWFL